MMILLLLLVVAVVALTLERNEGPGGRVETQETECKSDLAVVHYEGV